MSLIFFLIGLSMASLDLVIGSVDILPDIAGFLLMLIGLIPVFTGHKLPLRHCIWPVGAFLCSLVLLFFPEQSFALFFQAFQGICLFLIIFLLSRIFFPQRSKGSVESILYQSMLTAQFFLMISKFFAGLLGSVEIVAILTLLFQVLILIFEIVIVCRHWPARPIQ